MRRIKSNENRKTIIMLISIIVIMLFVLVMGSFKNANTSETYNGEEAESDHEGTTEYAEEDPRIEQARSNKIPTIIVSNRTAKAGDTVTVKATLVNNPGVLGMSLTLSYDDSVMKLTKVENGSAFEGILNFSHTKELGNGCIFLWDGEYLEKDQVLDGEIVSMEFEVLESAALGKTPIMLISDTDSTVDNDLKILDIATDNGFLTVE